MRRIFAGMLAAAWLFSAVAIDITAAEAVYVGPVTTLAGIGSHGATDGQMAQFNLPRGIIASQRGVYVADTFNNLVRHVDFDGNTSTVAGNIFGHDAFRFPVGLHRDGAIEGAMFNRPADIVLGSGNNLFVLDSSNHSLRIVMQGNVFTFAGTGRAGHNDGPAVSAMFNTPSAMTVDQYGNILIADSGNHAIRKIDTTGNVTTVAGQPGRYGHNDGTVSRALFNGPAGIAVDGDGRIFVADTGNHLIRMIYNGNVTTVAGRLIFPHEIDFDTTYYQNEWDENVPLGGFADGQRSDAMFNMPWGLAVWRDMLIVADTGNHSIRAVLPDGHVITLVGNGFPGHDDGTASGATFHLPTGVTIWGNTIYVADTGNNAIRMMQLNE